MDVNALTTGGVGLTECTIRELRAEENFLLDDFLYEAIFIPPNVEPPPRAITQKPELKIYVEDFGADEHDNAFVAVIDGKIIGAVWSRIMNDYGHIDDQTPSLAIAVRNQYRNRGLGTRLMKRLLECLKSKRYRRVSLSVQKINPARRFYERLGFKIFDERGDELILTKELR